MFSTIAGGVSSKVRSTPSNRALGSSLNEAHFGTKTAKTMRTKSKAFGKPKSLNPCRSKVKSMSGKHKGGKNWKRRGSKTSLAGGKHKGSGSSHTEMFMKDETGKHKIEMIEGMVSSGEGGWDYVYVWKYDDEPKTKSNVNEPVLPSPQEMLDQVNLQPPVSTAPVVASTMPMNYYPGQVPYGYGQPVPSQYGQPVAPVYGSMPMGQPQMPMMPVVVSQVPYNPSSCIPSSGVDPQQSNVSSSPSSSSSSSSSGSSSYS